jgi:hypothetical protein
MYGSPARARALFVTLVTLTSACAPAVPAPVAPGPSADPEEAVPAFCAALDEQAAPLRVEAARVSRTCAALAAASHAASGWWTPHCQVDRGAAPPRHGG